MKIEDALRSKNSLSSHPLDLSTHGIAPFPIEGRVTALISKKPAQGWTSSGIDRTLYLDMMEPIVRKAAGWISPIGSLIDPVLEAEWAQTTPRFASSAAILLHFNRIPELSETVYRAMTYCCSRLASPEVSKGGSPDFWMRELVTAFDCLEGIAPEALHAQWRLVLSTVDPEKIYNCTDSTHTRLREFHNWAVYSSSGESMRETSGIGASGDFLFGNGFFDTYMSEQIHRFTAFGMYRDPDDPFTYDITTRLQFATALAHGYNGPLKDMLSEILRRGNQTLLLFLSPDGFVPYGGRSSQFNFQETIVSALSELEALRYKSTNPDLAGAFKRQAHLCAKAITPWLCESSPFRHIKNQFMPKTRHGCDTYGQYSVYSLLATSYLGLAALFADDAIEEQPTPAETGIYALNLQPAFHKTFLSAEGAYVEIDTQADPHHDATGIGRILFKGYPPALPLGMPFASHPKCLYAEGYRPPERPLALGPEWTRPDGTRERLSEWGKDACVEVTESTAPDSCIGRRLVYRRNETEVRETVCIRSGAVSIDWSVTIAGNLAKPLCITVPRLMTDGGASAETRFSAQGMRVAFNGHAVDYQWSPDIHVEADDSVFANRHGIYRLVRLVAESGLCHLEINAPKR